MMRKTLYLGLLAALLAVCSCNGQAQVQGKAGEPSDSASPVTARELPLPEVPPTLTSHEARAEYIVAHFWDGMDFADTIRSRDRLFLEQNLVNFVSLFPYVDEAALRSPIYRLWERARGDSVAFGVLCDVVEHYLADPNSPMRNEEYYILFLEERLRLPGLSEEECVRPAYQLRTARKNRPGTRAADFAYTDREGTRRTLRGTRAGQLLLLLFYDPACGHCTDILESLRASKLLSESVGKKELTVLAVYTEGDRRLWHDTKADMPREWLVGIDESHVVDRGLYDLPAMPIIYLLDGDRKVLLKDVSLENLESYLARRKSAEEGL